MSTFPKLKTGVVAQYPSIRRLSYSTEVFRFLDGKQQTFRQHKAGVKRWTVQLDLLDDGEIAELCDFFQSQQGRFGSFSFEDPWDGTVHPDCSFESDAMTLEMTGESRTGTTLVITENNV